MTEERRGPAARAQLPEAVRKVAALYQGEVLADALVADGELDAPDPARDALWRQAAGRFPPFRWRILGLRLALGNARQAYAREGDTLRALVARRFAGARDLGVRHLLATLLCARATQAQGIVDGAIDLTREAAAIRREVGARGDRDGAALEGMSLARVVEAVLTGQLALARQTPTDVPPA
jgi:hypothetical protein